VGMNFATASHRNAKCSSPKRP